MEKNDTLLLITKPGISLSPTCIFSPKHGHHVIGEVHPQEPRRLLRDQRSGIPGGTPEPDQGGTYGVCSSAVPPVGFTPTDFTAGTQNQNRAAVLPFQYYLAVKPARFSWNGKTRLFYSRPVKGSIPNSISAPPSCDVEAHASDYMHPPSATPQH